MKQVFLDTNVIIDFLANRQPFSMEAAMLFELSFQKKISLYTSTVSFNNVYYILRQSLSHAKTIEILREFESWTNGIAVTEDVIQQALKSEFSDFEDAIQYECAKSQQGIDCIVTRNTKDFKKSIIPVMLPKEALTMIQKEFR